MLKTESGNMSDTKLYKEIGKAKRGEYGEEFNAYPEKVKKFYDRRCGTKDAKVWKKHKLEEEVKHEDAMIKQTF